MSEFHGYKCDLCGETIETGIRLVGNKAQQIDGERRKYSYRFDLCDRCFSRIKSEVKKEAGGGR